MLDVQGVGLEVALGCRVAICQRFRVSGCRVLGLVGWGGGG